MTVEIPLADITLAHLQALRGKGTVESRRLEFKQELPRLDDETAKRKFLNGASAFANTEGGDVLFGVAEGERDAAAELVGVPSDGLRDTIARLSDTLKGGIEPPMRVDFVDVPMDESRSIVVMRVERSWRAPHSVRKGDSFRIYVRSDRGSRPLGESEIRSAYELSGNLLEKARRWHLDRIAAIHAREMPVALARGGLLVIHVVPLSALAHRRAIPAQQLSSVTTLTPPGATSWNTRHNADGHLRSGDYSYTQLFRSGCVEVVSARLCGAPPAERELNLPFVDRTAILTVSETLEFHTAAGIGLPALVAGALVNVRGTVVADHFRDHFDPEPVDRDVVLLPEVVINDPPTSVATAIKDLLDTAWNSSNLPASPLFQSDGTHPHDVRAAMAVAP
jgi:hypothetical protein